jgi:hypothetical protein
LTLGALRAGGADTEGLLGCGLNVGRCAEALGMLLCGCTIVGRAVDWAGIDEREKFSLR